MGRPALNSEALSQLPERKRLDGWGEIASHLRRTVRTVQRWEAKEGLPIHRLKHSDGSSIYAFKDELEAWLAKKKIGNLGLAARDQALGVGNSEFRTPSDRAGTWFHARMWLYGLAGVALIASAFWVHYALQPLPSPRVLGFRRMTHDGRTKGTTLVTDGARLYFTEVLPTGTAISQIPMGGGEVQTSTTFFESPKVLDANPIAGEILVVDPAMPLLGQRGALWALPVSGSRPRRLGQLFVDAAAWSPDGKRMAYSTGADLYTAKSDGSDRRKIVTLEGIASSIRWSPDGQRLRLTMAPPSNFVSRIFELHADGSQAHEVFANWAIGDNLEGWNWTPGGRYFLFSRGIRSSDLWVAPDSSRAGWVRSWGDPTRLTSGPLLAGACVVNATGSRLFFVGSDDRSASLRYDAATGNFEPFLAGISAWFPDVFRDGNWVTYTDTTGWPVLWRRRMDGSEATQLTFPPLHVEVPRWSPDGKMIAFLGQKTPRDRYQAYVIPAMGGDARQVLPSMYPEGQPTWSPDSTQVAFGEMLNIPAESASEMHIHVVNVRTHQSTVLPGSEGLWSARWSPDGRHMAALSADSRSLLVFDFDTRRWEKVGTAGGITDLNWSRRSEWIYFEDGLPPAGPAVFRVRWRNHQVERITSLKREPPISSVWLGVTPNDSLLVVNQTGGSEIYSLDLEAP